MDFQQAVEQAQALCEKIKQDPQARLQTRQNFYKKFGFAIIENKHLFGFGNSELAFMEWEIDRGVLTWKDNQPVSPWWSACNLKFIFYSELAGIIKENDVDATEAPTATKQWLAYIESPSARSWYKAHNTTILAGFYETRSEAKEENAVEQFFLNICLYRLMFAQALVEDKTMFGDIGELLANPRLFAVDLMVHSPWLYPAHYPLTAKDKIILLGEDPNPKHIIRNLEIRLLDHEIILPNIMRLYDFASQLNLAAWLTSAAEVNEKGKVTLKYPEL